MDWDHLRIFLAIARSGQILAAARRLHLDHATVSRRLGALEEQLGALLFERRTTGCVPTAAGERLIEIAERVESEVLKAQAMLGETDLALAGTVRVGAPDGLGTYFLAPLLGRFAERHPELTIQLVPLPRVFSLSKREADIAITLARPEEGRLFARKLTDYRLSLYASKAYLARTGPIESRADLANRTLVTYAQDFVYSPALAYADELIGLVKSRFECASVVGQLEAVRADAGIGVLHDYAARHHADLVPILPDIEFRRAYWIVAHEEHRALRRVAEIITLIVEAAQGARERFG